MMKKRLLDKTICVSLVVLNIVFLVYWCILAFYSRPHYDDLGFLWKMREMSVFEYVKEMYFTRSGRFVGYGINGVMSVVTNALGFHQLWAIFFYVLGIGASWLVIKDSFQQLPRWGLFMGLCFVYNLYVLTNIDFPVFTWLCAMGYYYGLPMAFLVLKYLNLERLNWKQWLLLIVLIVYIGGGSETFPLIVLLAMFVCGMHYWYSKDWNVRNTWALPQVRRIVWTAIVMLVLWAIVVVAPGNYVRMETDDSVVHPLGVIGWAKAMVNVLAMFFYFMAFYIPYYLVAFALAFYAGSKSRIELPCSKRKIVLWLVLVFWLYLFVSSLPSAYLYNGFGIQRTYTGSVLLLLLVFVGMGYVFGVGRKSKPSGWFVVASMLALTVIMCVNIVQDTPSAKDYGKAVDERISYLCSLRDAGQKDTVTVEPLPVPYTEDVKHFVLSLIGKNTPKTMLYYISDTEETPNEYEYHLKRLLNLGFDFVLPAGEGKSRIEE